MGAEFGAFGKMPSLGDFFRVDIDRGFVTAWDHWLQDSMADAKLRLDSRWDDCYMNAPIWRFSLSAGLAGDKKAMGILMPSVDRVGRQFPLTLMCNMDTRGPILRDHFLNNSVLTAAENLALDALDDSMTRDRLAENLGNLPPMAQQMAGNARYLAGSMIVTGGDAKALLPDLAAEGTATQFATPSIWTTVVAGEARMMICEKMPDKIQALGLFDLTAPIWLAGVS